MWTKKHQSHKTTRRSCQKGWPTTNLKLLLWLICHANKACLHWPSHQTTCVCKLAASIRQWATNKQKGLYQTSGFPLFPYQFHISASFLSVSFLFLTHSNLPRLLLLAADESNYDWLFQSNFSYLSE